MKSKFDEIQEARVKKILEQISKPRFFTEFTKARAFLQCYAAHTT